MFEKNNMKSFFAIKKNILYFFRRLLGDKHIYQQDVLKYLKDIRNPIILEAGAADGFDTLRFSKLAPAATIHAFEPVTKNFNMLKARVESCPNVNIYNLALTDSDGTAEINISNNSDDINGPAVASSILKPEHHTTLYSNITFEQKETVETKSLDSWASEAGVDHIDAMWLDMQGYEYLTLKKSTKILPTVRVIYSEVCFKELFKGVCLYNDYKEWLLSSGFKVVMEEFSDEGFGNVLFVKKD